MSEKPESVAAYIAAAPSDWQATLERLRTACRANLAGATEVIAYGMPGYRRGDAVEVSFAKQARYLSLYILHTEVIDAHRDRLAGLSVGKSCIRYRSPEQINWEVVTSLLVASAAGSGPVCS